jgi:hypothetical protein
MYKMTIEIAFFTLLFFFIDCLDYRRTEPPMNPRPSGNRAMLYLTGAAAAGGLGSFSYTFLFLLI